ncbi:MAG: PAS domain S-box protein [Rhodospirillaceae bacterium]|nr:PAS domain S-box protein [Rhodospirillaceae bacterium]
MLGVMANIRGTLRLSLTSIRAYLLTGEKYSADEYGALWARNEQHFLELRKSARLLSPPQIALFEEFKVARASFAPLPAKMFEIRSSEKWNMANYLLATEAIPRADKILELLLGAIQKDGSRDGGMTGSQQNLLEIDVRHSAAAARRLLLLQWLLLLAGASLATLIAYFTARSIVAPVKNMTSAMLCLADGEMNFEIPDQDRNDEIGDMAGAVQVFKENALEQDRLESEKLELFEELDFQKSAIDKHAIVSIADADGDIIYANDKFCEISGYTRQELLGQNHRILKSNEHSPAFYSDIWDTISAGKVWQGEIKNYRKDGEYYWIMSTIVPALDNDGKPLRYVSIRSDISERKEAEIAALAASRAKSELMANMSHELRTPLNAIIGFSGTMMAEAFGPIDNEKYREYLGDIHSSGQHLLELIADILDVSAVEAGSLKLHRENINLPDLVAGIIRIIRPRAEENGLTVTSSVAAEITEIYADERRVKQILLNLLGNAVKYTPEGGDVAVNMSMNKGGVLIIEVSDTGIGMDADELSEAMSVFGRVARGLDRQTEGTGLGLPLTKGLVDLHDGTMEIKSEKGLGTTVTVTIPCAPISETAD